MSRRDLQSLMRNGSNVVGVKSLTVATEAWSPESFLPGDILEQLKVEGVAPVVAPFSGGKSGLQKELRKLAQSLNGVSVRVRRGGKAVDIQARVLTEEANLLKKQQFLLAAYHDPNYVCLLLDTTEEDCKSVQENTLLVMERSKTLRHDTERDQLLAKLAATKLEDSYAPYPWKRKMEAFCPAPGSSMVFSLLLMPHQPNRLTSAYMDAEETSARAMAWLSAAQASGVPIAFVNIQTEPFLLQGPGFKATGIIKQDPETIANLGLYNVQAYDGLDIDILRAIRLWYVPASAELAVDLRPDPGESRLGVGISRTEEGFCHVSSVDEGTAADRAGLRPVYQAACQAGKLLVISRVGGVKVTPWMVASTGNIRSFDIATIKNKLLLHKQTGQPVQLHIMLWDGALRTGDILDPTSSSEVVAPIVVQETGPMSSQAAGGDRISPQFWFADEEAPAAALAPVADSVVAPGRGQLQPVVSFGPPQPEPVERPTGSNRFRVAPEPWPPAFGQSGRFDGNALSFRFEVPNMPDAGFHSEHPVGTPWIGSGRPSSPVFNSL